MGKIVMKNWEEYNENKKLLLKKGAEFTVTMFGSSEVLNYNGREFQYSDFGSTNNKGHHLSVLVKKDIDEWIKSKKGNITPYYNTYREQMFNLSAIEKSIGSPVVAIDIKDCYWKTARNLGYISDMTYIKGKRDSLFSKKNHRDISWKDGRNAAIGGLIKTTLILRYKDGVRVSKQFVPIPKEYSYVRNHIIGTVYDMFHQLYMEVGHNFFMFLTDCVFCHADKMVFCERYLKGHDYRITKKPIELISVDRDRKIVKWYDFESKVYDEYHNVIGKGKEKYYHYAPHQIVDSYRDSQTPLMQIQEADRVSEEQMISNVKMVEAQWKSVV